METIEIKGVNYKWDDPILDKFRENLLRTQPTLCANHFIKSIRSKGKSKMTYDWMHIFQTAIEAGYDFS